MDNLKTNSLSCHIQLLMDREVDFTQKLKQHLVFKSDQVANQFKFIGGLLSKGVLFDGSNDSEENFGLKEMMVRLAMMIACAQGADGIADLMDVLQESGNLQFVSDFRAWAKQEFGLETKSEFGERKGDALAAPTTNQVVLAKHLKTGNEMTSSSTKLLNKILSRLEDDFVEQFEGHLVGKASEIVNVPAFYSSLVNNKVLDENDMRLVSGPDVLESQQMQNFIKIACSKKVLGSLVLALQDSNNEWILAETYDWLGTSPGRKKNYPISVKSLQNQPVKEEPKVVRSSFFEQAALPHELSKLATVKYTTKGVSLVQFDKKRMMASSTDGRLSLWNCQKAKEAPMEIAVHVKNITCFQYDEEILVLGTAQGAVHLFDATTFEEKWSVRLGNSVESLKFLESNLAVITRTDDGWKKLLSLEICRPDMRLLNQIFVRGMHGSPITGISMYPDRTFVNCNNVVYVNDTKSCKSVLDGLNYECFLTAPTAISTLNVGDLISTKRVAVAGCMNREIALWKTSKLSHKQQPNMTFEGHPEAIVSLCFLNGHLLSLDRSGKLFMWSGHDLESPNITPAPRLLIQSSKLTSFSVHERWFASSSSTDDLINVWTVPDLWLRTG